jgi:hypothetical protein
MNIFFTLAAQHSPCHLNPIVRKMLLPAVGNNKNIPAHANYAAFLKPKHYHPLRHPRLRARYRKALREQKINHK